MVVHTAPCHPLQGGEDEPGEWGGESAWVRNQAVPEDAAWLQGRWTESTVLS